MSAATPLELTRSARDVSVTERGQFRSCRRRWVLETLNNWTPKTPQWALEFGTGIHSALETYYEHVATIQNGDASIDDPLADVLDVFKQWYIEQDKQQAKLLGGLYSDEARQELFEMYGMGVNMLTNYASYSGDIADIDPWDILAIEGRGKGGRVMTAEDLRADADPPYGKSAKPVISHGRVLVPIVNPNTKRCLPGRPYLSARIDLLVSRKGKTWVVDHKTTASSPSDRGIDFEDQITGYCYVVWRLTGVRPRGTIFNYLVKNEPKEPRIVRVTAKKPEGDLSTAKDQLCLAADYRQALIDRGLMVRGKVDSADHADCYAGLLAKGWDPFFKRFEVQRNEHEIESFEARLFQEYKDMRDVHYNRERAYPNPSTWHCPSCSVAPVCQAIEDGSDVEGIIESRYMQAPDRKA